MSLRRTALLGTLATSVLLATACAGATPDVVKVVAAQEVRVEGDDAGSGPDTTLAAPPTSTTTTTALDLTPSDERVMSPAKVITDGPLTPKSVEASSTGLFFAQNMIYSHTITVYDRSLELVKSIPDAVDLAEWGYEGHPGTSKGGPVEMAFTHDGAKAYVSNYQMYGAGFDNPGDDKCAKGSWDNSFVYRIDTTSLEIDQVIEVGPVPKYVAVTPDDSTVLVTNWCGYDMSVIDVAGGKETRRVDIGRFPRGIAVAPNSSVAYVAVMGSKDIAVVDLVTYEVTWLRDVGQGPRHLVIDSAGAFLYATLNAEGKVAKIDLATRQVVAKVASPTAPRSMTIAPDGRSLYVVNYSSNAVSKIRTSDMTQLQRLTTGHHPIGITYDPVDRRVWVANYGGSLHVYDDKAP